MIVLNILGYFGRNKQNSYAALKLHNCFAYLNQKINPWRMVFYLFILLLRLLSY